LATPADIFAGATWIAAPFTDGPLPVFRRRFDVEHLPDKATIAICGLGQFELRVNGEKVGDAVMEPAWSNFRKSCLYVVHDITPHLRTGENELRVLLGNGMYNVVGGQKRYRKFKGSFGPPKLIAAATISDLRVMTDASWTVAAGPITFSCIYGGEDCDARRNEPADWSPAVVTDAPGGALIEQDCPPIRVMQSFEPARVTEPLPGVRVFDLGQNFSGRPTLAVRGAAGATVKLITGELLDDAGCVSQQNSGSPVYFTYTARGDDSEETWHPRFTYTGFRYVQTEGDVDIIKHIGGEFIHADLAVVGHFECSNGLLNRIHALIVNAIRSNMQSVLTDCPHREKLGWLEQAYLMASSISANFDARKYFRKICRDMRDAQHDNGCVPTIAPQYTSFKPPWDIFNDSPEWGSAIVQVPQHCYFRYGDRQIVEDNYDAMRRYVAYLATRVDERGLVDYGLGDWYDIGPGDPGFSKLTPRALTATAAYFLDLGAMWIFARLLDRDEDAATYAAAGKRAREAVRAAAFPRSSQTAVAMHWFFNLIPDVSELVADIRAHGNHVTAGDIGFNYVLRALAEQDRSDVIFDLLIQSTPPSYGAILARGATTLTEAWDANPKVSQNHLMLGHAESWFHECLGGVRIDMTAPDPRGRIVIQPTPVGDVSWARVGHDSVLGPINCAWRRRRDDVLTVELDLPADATVRLPDKTVRYLASGRYELTDIRICQAI
jgi:hypothetical protein